MQNPLYWLYLTWLCNLISHLNGECHDITPECNRAQECDGVAVGFLPRTRSVAGSNLTLATALRPWTSCPPINCSALAHLVNDLTCVYDHAMIIYIEYWWLMENQVMWHWWKWCWQKTGFVCLLNHLRVTCISGRRSKLKCYRLPCWGQSLVYALAWPRGACPPIRIVQNRWVVGVGGSD